MSALLMRALEAQAADSGIEDYATVRKELILARDTALQATDFTTSVFLSHVIWWLAAMHEEVNGV